MIAFNKEGLITPDRAIETDFETFVSIFVFNECRRLIFEQYKSFLSELNALEIKGFYQWINGSFTTHKAFPNDMDIVTFIDADEYDKQEQNLRKLAKKWSKIDAYFVKEYPENHKKAMISSFDKTEWLFLFSTDRKKRKKGFVQLNF